MNLILVSLLTMPSCRQLKNWRGVRRRFFLRLRSCNIRYRTWWRIRTSH